VKWANAISILSLALSGGIFLLLGTGLTSAKDSPATPITVVDASGGTALLDTLLPAGEVGLIVSEESIVKNDVRQTENNVNDAVNIGNTDSGLTKPKQKSSTTTKSSKSTSSKSTTTKSTSTKSSKSTTSKSTKSTASATSAKPSSPTPSITTDTDAPCVNINDAAEADLITIKGIGPATAAKIIEYRAQKGRFVKKEDILNVKGIGPAKFAQIEGRICL